MDTISAIILGMLIGAGIAALYIVYRINVIIRRVSQAVDEAIENTMMGVNVEKHNDMYRFYDEKTGQFLLQSTTLAGLRQEFQTKFPTKTCFIAGGDEEILKEIKEELAKTKL